MQYRLLIILPVFITFLACQNRNEINVKAVSQKDSIQTAKPVKDFRKVEFASKKDVTCGMPLTARNIKDTAHYKGKVYGFCSQECKNEFLKNPEGYK